MISQIVGLNHQAYTSKTSEENAPQGTTSVIVSSARQAFEGLATAIGWTKSLPSQEKVHIQKKTKITAVQEALSNFPQSLISKQSDTQLSGLMAALTGKPYQSQEATAFENYAYDILMIAELSRLDRDEERSKRLKGLDKIGAVNAFTLLAVAYKHAESLAQDPNLSRAERDELLKNKQFLASKLLDLLSRNPEASASVRSGELRLNLEQVDSAFMNQLENQKNLEEKQSDVQESRFNRIFAIA